MRIGLGIGIGMFVGGGVTFAGTVPECSPDVPAATWHLWEPSDETGVKVWLRASLGVTKDGGDAVSLWEDQSGNGNDYAQSTGADKFIWTDAALGGRAAMRLDGSQVMTGADLSALTEGCMFVVWEQDADPPAGGNVVWTMGGQASNVPYSDSAVYESFGRTTQAGVGNLAPSFADPHVYDVQSKTNNFQVNVNGTNRFFTATNTPQFLASNTLGHATASFFGHLAEVIVFDAFLAGTAKYDRIMRNLRAYYSI